MNSTVLLHTKSTDYYQIMYVNERREEFRIFSSTDVDVLAQIYAKLLLFETLFQTFPNASCKFVLEKNYNYQQDLVTYRFDTLYNFNTWTVLIDDIIHCYGSKLGHFQTRGPYEY